MAQGRYGTHVITGIRYGTHPVTSVRRGATIVWSASGMYDAFDRADGVIGTDWTDEGHSDAAYVIGVRNNQARMAIPDSAFGSGVKESKMRYNAAVTAGDDGDLEVTVGNRGDAWTLYSTRVFRRVSNGAYTHGVGLDFTGGVVSIVARIASVDTLKVGCGGYSDADDFRLNQAGNVHSLYKNGDPVGEWDDSGATAAKGAGYRSMAMYMTGTLHDFFNGVRVSAAMDSIQCS